MDSKKGKRQDEKKYVSEEEIVVKLRDELTKRGSLNFKGISKKFRQADKDRSNALSVSEIRTVCRSCGVAWGDDEYKDLFNILDIDADGHLDMEEFIGILRGPMKKGRLALVNTAFDKMDKTGDGVITMADLEGVYRVEQHPKYKSGEWGKQQVFKEFLKSFEADDQIDGTVKREEFIDYYVGVSINIDNDAYFDLMMRNSWRI